MEYHNYNWNYPYGPDNLRDNMANWKRSNNRPRAYQTKPQYDTPEINDKQGLRQIFSQMSVQPSHNAPANKSWKMFRSTSAPSSFQQHSATVPAERLPIFGCNPTPPPPWFVVGGFVGSKSQEKTSSPLEVFVTSLISANLGILQPGSRQASTFSVSPPAPPSTNSNYKPEKLMSYKDAVTLLSKDSKAVLSTPELTSPAISPQKVTDLFRDSRTTSECSSDGSWASFEGPASESATDLCSNPFLKQILGSDDVSEDGESDYDEREAKHTANVSRNSSGTEDTLEDEEDEEEEMKCLAEGDFVDTNKWQEHDGRGVALSPILPPKDSFPSPEGFKGLLDTPTVGVVCFMIDYDSTTSEGDGSDYDFSDEEDPEGDDEQVVDPESEAVEEKVRLANERWENGLTCDANCPDIRAPTKVAFALEENLTEICILLDLDLSYQAARKGEWETYALDRQHFRSRINSLATVLEPVLQPEHRHRVYARLNEESALCNQCNQSTS